VKILEEDVLILSVLDARNVMAVLVPETVPTKCVEMTNVEVAAVPVTRERLAMQEYVSLLAEEALVLVLSLSLILDLSNMEDSVLMETLPTISTFLLRLATTSVKPEK
jgi:hypothetical protein